MTELHDVNFRGSFSPDRIALLEEQVAALSFQLGKLLPQPAFELPEPPVAPKNWSLPQPTSSLRGRAKVVRALLRRRRARERHFSDHLFADPAWDMLLDLYAAHYEGQRVSVSSLCIAASVPATTALRWIKTMEEEGHFVRSSDPTDGRRIFIRLSDNSRAKMDDYFDEIGD